MHASDLLTRPIRAGAALRHRRLFHPCGVLARGTLERLAPPGDGLPVESGTVVARVSKGVGTPGALPDFAGFAWRMSPGPFVATPWDVLLVSAGLGAGNTVNRLLLRPVVSWSEAMYSSLMPLQHAGRLWWEEQPDHDIAFDPVLHTAPDVRVWPRWLRDLRRLAYRSSRKGREEI